MLKLKLVINNSSPGDANTMNMPTTVLEFNTNSGWHRKASARFDPASQVTTFGHYPFLGSGAGLCLQ